MFSVAPMTVSPGPFWTGIASPVSIDSFTADAPSTTTPSSGTFSPGRTRTRSPTTTACRATSDSTPPRTTRALWAWSPTRRLIAPVVWPLARASSHRPEQDQADDDRRAVEIRLRMQTGLVDDLREQRHEDAVGPGGAGSHGHQRVHVGRAVAGRPDCGDVEAATGPDLDDRRRQERQPVDRLHRDDGLGPEHRGHDRQGDGDGCGGADEQATLLVPSKGFVRLQLDREGFVLGIRRDFGADVVAGRFNRRDELIATDPNRVHEDGRPFRGQVHGGLEHAVRPGEESLDPAHARRAGHALDRQHDLEAAGHWIGMTAERWRSFGWHTPG